jgi:hypothetical protein
MNKSVTFTVKIRTLVLAAVAFIAVVGISQTLIANNMSKTATASGTTIVNGVDKNEVVGATHMFSPSDYDVVSAVTMNGKIYVVYYWSGGYKYREAIKAN